MILTYCEALVLVLECSLLAAAAMRGTGCPVWPWSRL